MRRAKNMSCKIVKKKQNVMGIMQVRQHENRRAGFSLSEKANRIARFNRLFLLYY